jgi:hypothetical protein
MIHYSKGTEMKGIIFMFSIGLIFLCCCTTRYSKPYSAKKTSSILGKYFDTEIEIIEGKIIKQSPYAENHYTFKDKILGFIFTADVKINYDKPYLLLGNNIYDNYYSALMLHFSESAKMLADSYGIKLITVENIQQKPFDKIYINEPEQLVEVSKLYFQLKTLYGLNKYQRYNKYPLKDPQFFVYYLEKDNQNINESKLICPEGYRYILYGDIRKTIYEPYLNEETFLNNLSGWWNQAKRQGDVPVWTPDRDFEKIWKKKRECNE